MLEPQQIRREGNVGEGVFVAHQPGMTGQRLLHLVEELHHSLQALEASVRYLANDYGPRGIRVNAISAGPVRTLAGAGISDARYMFSYQQRNAPLRKTVSLDEIGGSALYLLSELSGGVTGEIHYVDSGYHIVSMPTLDELKRTETGRE